MVDKTDHDLLMDVHGALLGVNGQGGLLRDHASLKKDYYKFKERTMMVFFFFVGSGVLGAGIWKLVLG